MIEKRLFAIEEGKTKLYNLSDILQFLEHFVGFTAGNLQYLPARRHVPD